MKLNFTLVNKELFKQKKNNHKYLNKNINCIFVNK